MGPNVTCPVVDLRSDTVTLPCQEMRHAMMSAEVGDDVYGEDPSVNSLQRNIAKVFGKPAALFVLSGAMGNLVSIMSHCPARSQEVIMGSMCHIHLFEQGNIASLAGVHHRTVTNLSDGTFNLEEARALVRTFVDPHFPTTALLALENTHNACGGRVLPLSFLKEARAFADEFNLPVHMDGARIMNAATALDVDVSEIACYADSVSMCFSKGIGAPMGAIIVGETDFIKRCLWNRKAVGGAFRQVGIVAAGAQFGFDRARDVMREDHRRTRDLAEKVTEALSAISSPPFSIDLATVDSNMIFLWPHSISAAALTERLSVVTSSEDQALGPGGTCCIRSAQAPSGSVRLVFHRSLPADAVALAAAKLAFVARELGDVETPDAKRG